MDKLKPYAHLIGKVPDEKLAEMAGLSLEELAVAKAELAAEEKKTAEKPVTTEEIREAFAETVGKKAAKLGGALGAKPDLSADLAELRALLAEERAARQELEYSHRFLADQYRALAASHDSALCDIATLRASAGVADLMPVRKDAPAPKVPAPAELPSGKAVKVVKNAKIKGYQGRSTALHYGDILTGEEAVFMLDNYPNLVRVYG